LVSAAPRDRLELALASTADLLASLTSDPIRLAPRGQDSAGIMARSGAIYRERQAHLRALIAVLQDAPTTSANDDEDSTRAWWRAVREALADRRARLLVTQLRDRCRDGTGARPVEQLVPSLVHMHANRLGLNRQDEQLMLGLLDRTLRSIRACP
jgi:thiopeptide-type bacteriocin biosynthesis protein